MVKQIISETAFWGLVDDFENIESFTPKMRKSFKHYILELQSKIEDLEADVEHYKEEYNRLEQDLQDNYQPLPRSCYTGDGDDDRY